MKKIWKKGWVLTLAVCIIAISGCGKQDETNVYDDVLSSLSKEQAYAYVKVGDSVVPILLVTGGTYQYEDTIEACLDCEVYYAWDGKAETLGSLESMGTAYPIAYDKDGIYAGGPHFMVRYVLDGEKKQLVVAEYASEVFDENGNATYTYSAENGEEQEVVDDSYIKDLFERYSKAAVVNFGKSS